MELSGALSNPRLQVELKGLAELHIVLRNGMSAAPWVVVKPRCTPIISNVLQVLQLGDGQPMKLMDIYSACVSLLGEGVSYRALKNGLSDHQRGKHPAIIRVRRGFYRLNSPATEAGRRKPVPL